MTTPLDQLMQQHPALAELVDAILIEDGDKLFDPERIRHALHDTLYDHPIPNYPTPHSYPYFVVQLPPSPRILEHTLALYHYMNYKLISVSESSNPDHFTATFKKPHH